MRVAVLITGRGSNLGALVEAVSVKDFPAEIALVLSSKPDAAGLEIAEKAGIPTAIIDHNDFDSRTAFDEALNEHLEAADIQFICLAGFMRILTEEFVGKWRDRLINIHPSLLPSFKGRNTHERVLHAGVCFSGCTVHFVRPEMDEGPAIVQAAVPVHAEDSADDLAARVLKAEHHAYPLALRLIAEGRVRVIDEKVHIEGAHSPGDYLLNPTEES
ncbi:MAG: phosphoribosylglycinamide formyltransferase [Rhodospirillaceae bacterium]|nr:phosphoribosylglycinamide formyltransferase [Rhodospirillaceae bacterium]MBT5374287.1 phosphoribosylglycinamide formyltransferase [Rhodospirillaceae bacterium]MBT5658683.1 phosphoribosylglycinamide formyltransferase [Rhodospirillaceae bacterium]MBT5751220.1 phosphoribosylglycinamide formyltransferase [Rhodospirillaceae bacterium]